MISQFEHSTRKLIQDARIACKPMTSRETNVLSNKTNVLTNKMQRLKLGWCTIMNNDGWFCESWQRHYILGKDIGRI